MNLSELKQEYLNYLHYEALSSENTITNRRSEMNIFVREMEKQGLETIEEIHTSHLRAFISQLRTEKGYQPVSICNVISGLRSFYSFAVKKGHVADDISQKIKKPQLEQTEIEHFTWDEVERIFLAVPRNASYVRNLCLLLFLYYTGIRMEELSQVKQSDLSHDLDELYVEKGKGDKSRYLPLHPLLQKALKVHLKSRKVQNSLWLFPGRDGDKPLSKSRIYRIVREMGELAGVEKRVSPHTFRHSFATHLHEQGVDVFRLMQLLGHVNIEKTAIYTHIKDKELMETVSWLE